MNRARVARGLGGQPASIVPADHSEAVATANLDENAFSFGQHMASCVENPGLGPVLAALTAQQAALQANRRSGADRAAVVDLHMSRHRSQAPGANCLAH